jgi:ligand-binding sensor domain-containing protein/AraC-like DNA-binding protein
LGTLAGLIVVKRVGESFISEFRGFKNIKVNTIFEDRSGTIWVGTMEKGLLRINQDKYFFFNKKNTFTTNDIMCLAEDFPGNLWVGTYGGGIYFKQPNSDKISRFDEDNDLPSNSIYFFLEDREKTLWIGTEGGGLNYLREARVITYTKRDGLSDNIIFTLFEDSLGGLWTGTMGYGIDCLKNNKVQNISQQNGLSSNSVVSFTEYPEGWLWIGTRGSGANLLDLKNGNIKVFTTRNGLTDNIIRALYVDPEGILWAGTDNGGLHQYVNNLFLFIKKIRFRINTIFKDDQGSIWLGTWGNGLYRLKGETLQVFNQQNGFQSEVVLSIHQDENSHIWIGTYGNGIVHYHDGVFTAITKKDGLNDNTFYSILEDDQKNLWMSSNNGIVSISRLEIEKYLQNKKGDKLLPTVFTKEHGMKSNECNGGGQPVGLMSRSGQIWFPTTKGISMIDPERISINTLPPSVVIKKFSVNGKPIPMDDKSPINSWEQGVEIHYTALSFIVPEKVRFKTKLTGLNRRWVDAGNSRIAKYSGLRPGKYTFTVIAANSDGTWNRKGKTFKFYLKPKFYQTAIFKIAILLGILVISYGLYFLGKKIDHIRKMRKKFYLTFLDKEKKEEYIRKIFYLIEMKKVYKDPDLCLNSFAHKININPRYLSQLVNDELKKSFLNLINSYRIEEAKKLLSDPRHRSISVIEVCMEVGFNSKSSFNRAFKKFAKQTPSEFKKKYSH